MNLAIGTVPSIGIDKDAARQAKLVDAAHQFEGVMLEEMLKSMQSDSSGMSSDSAEDDTSGASGTLRSMGTEAVAKAISQGGGFGIARQIIAKVTSEDKHGDHKDQIRKS